MRYRSEMCAAVAVVFLIGCGGGGGGSKPSKYTGRTVTIGGQTWMAENLNIETANSKCYDNDPANCQKYGRLYNWNDALTVCPAGWHLPSDAEWTMLVNYVGGRDTAGKKLKSTSGWNNNGNGTDDYGFSALPGGVGVGGGFISVGNGGRWWSTTESDASYAWDRGMYYNNEFVGRVSNGKANEFSVRCVQD